MEIYLIRHTTPQVAPGICYGQTDLALDSAKFPRELAMLKAKLPEDIELFYSSPLQRCSILARHLTSSFTTDPRLLELDFGKWENRPWESIAPAEIAPWYQDFVNCPARGGESYVDLAARTQSFLQGLPGQAKAKIGVITHAGNIRAILSSVLDLPLAHSFRIHLNYGAVAHILWHSQKDLRQLYALS